MNTTEILKALDADKHDKYKQIKPLLKGLTVSQAVSVLEYTVMQIKKDVVIS